MAPLTTKDDDIIRNPERLAALRSTGLVDAPPERTLQQLARVAAKALDAKVALVSLVEEERQCFRNAAGPGADALPADRQTPLSHSFCKHAVVSRRPFVVDDARLHPLVADNPSVTELGVIAYAGIPLATADGHMIGSLCVIDSRPRHWSDDQIEMLTALADAAMAAIELRTAAAAPAAAPAAAGAEAAPDSPAAARLTGAVAEYLRRLDRYDESIRASEPTPDTLAAEERLRAAVEEAAAQVRAASEAPPSVLGAAAPLKEAARTYFEAEARRSAIVEAFQEGRAGLSDAEAAFREMADAEQALRLALRTHEMRAE